MRIIGILVLLFGLGLAALGGVFGVKTSLLEDQLQADRQRFQELLPSFSESTTHDVVQLTFIQIELRDTHLRYGPSRERVLETERVVESIIDGMIDSENYRRYMLIALGIGGFFFVIGLVLIVVGFIRKKSNPSAQVVQSYSQPFVVQQGNVQPDYVQPGSGQPAAGQPGYVQPATGQPAAVQPDAGQPAAVQPGYAQPGHVQPGFGQPAAVQTGGGQPSTPQPVSSASQSVPTVDSTSHPGSSPHQG